jgi:hypothetical protein
MPLSGLHQLVSMPGEPTNPLSSKTYHSSVEAVLLLEAQALSTVCKARIEGVEGKSDA